MGVRSGLKFSLDRGEVYNVFGWDILNAEKHQVAEISYSSATSPSKNPKQKISTIGLKLESAVATSYRFTQPNPLGRRISLHPRRLSSWVHFRSLGEKPAGHRSFLS